MPEWNPVKGLELVDEWTNMNDRDEVIIHYKTDRYQKLTWKEVREMDRSTFKDTYLLERAPSPEPKNLGAVVTFAEKDTGTTIVLIKFRNDDGVTYIGGMWVEANRAVYSTWDWEAVLRKAKPGSIVVKSNGAFDRPPTRPVYS